VQKVTRLKSLFDTPARKRYAHYMSPKMPLPKTHEMGDAPLPRLHNIQALRGIAAMLVVIAHLFIMETKYSPDQLLGGWAEYGGVGVDLFFVISGFIMVYVTSPKRDSKNGQSAGQFLFARFSRIYPLYWLVSLALIAVYMARPDMVSSSIKDAPNISASLLLWPQGRPPLLTVGWTLIHEIFFYCVFAVSLLLPRRFLPLFLSIWAIVTLAGYFMGLGRIHPTLVIVFSPMTIEFCLGAMAALLLQKTARLSPAQAKRTVFIGALVLVMIIARAAKYSDFILANFLLRALYFAGPTFLIVMGLARLDMAKIHMPKFLRTLGDWSYAIYLTHVLSLTVMGRLWQKYSTEGLADNIIVLLLMVIGAIAVGGLTYVLFERPMLQLTKLLRARIFK
jgi:peptidoglycan/LPS O-acetylase OafA/YrhL